MYDNILIYRQIKKSNAIALPWDQIRLIFFSVSCELKFIEQETEYDSSIWISMLAVCDKIHSKTVKFFSICNFQ